MRRDGAYFLLKSSRNARNFITTYVIYRDNSAKSLHTLVTTALDQLVLKLPHRKGVQLKVTPALPSIATTSDPISLAFEPASPTGSRHLVKHVLLQHFFPG